VCSLTRPWDTPVLDLLLIPAAALAPSLTDPSPSAPLIDSRASSSEVSWDASVTEAATLFSRASDGSASRPTATEALFLEPWTASSSSLHAKRLSGDSSLVDRLQGLSFSTQPPLMLYGSSKGVWSPSAAEARVGVPKEDRSAGPPNPETPSSSVSSTTDARVFDPPAPSSLRLREEWDAWVPQTPSVTVTIPPVFAAVPKESPVALVPAGGPVSPAERAELAATSAVSDESVPRNVAAAALAVSESNSRVNEMTRAASVSSVASRAAGALVEVSSNSERSIDELTHTLTSLLGGSPLENTPSSSGGQPSAAGHHEALGVTLPRGPPLPPLHPVHFHHYAPPPAHMLHHRGTGGLRAPLSDSHAGFSAGDGGLYGRPLGAGIHDVHNKRLAPRSRRSRDGGSSSWDSGTYGSTPFYGYGHASYGASDLRRSAPVAAAGSAWTESHAEQRHGGYDPWKYGGSYAYSGHHQMQGSSLWSVPAYVHQHPLPPQYYADPVHNPHHQQHHYPSPPFHPVPLGPPHHFSQQQGSFYPGPPITSSPSDWRGSNVYSSGSAMLPGHDFGYATGVGLPKTQATQSLSLAPPASYPHQSDGTANG
jgi:hypothetical protein